jgi:hypothetical protein
LKFNEEKFKILKEVSTSRGGKCLGFENGRFVFECRFGHIWKTTYWHIVNNKTWCKSCSCGLYERIVRCYFEQIFEKKFISCRPKWLINDKTNRRMELDGYCKELNLAFEHNGLQHYKEISKYKNKYEDIVYRDNLKKKLCEEKNVKLIIIPSLVSILNFDDLKFYIEKECNKFGIVIDKNLNEFEIDIKTAYLGHQYQKYKELLKVCNKRNIKCLSKKYISSNYKMLFECKKCNIKWRATPNNIKCNRGCPKCGQLKSVEIRTFTFNKVKKYIEKEGYLLLSDNYENCKSHLSIKCKYCKKKWNISFDNFKKGYRCPYCCNNIKKSINDMIIFAKKNNIECLSDTYINAHTKLIWKCSYNHIWEECYNSIYNKKNKCVKCWRKNGKNNVDDGNI